MLSKHHIIGLSTVLVLVVVAVSASTMFQSPDESTVSGLTAALTRGVKAGSTRVRAKSSSSKAATPTLSLPTYGFTLTYPTSWKTEKDPQEGGAMNVYLSSESNTFFMTVTLATMPTSTVKLDDIVSATLAEMPSSLQFKVVKSESGKLAGVTTKVLTVTQKADDGSLLKGQQVFLIKGKTLCVFFFTNVPASYNSSLQLFNTTLKTLTLK
ncbi:MAG: hypothetical protein WCS85_03255 [Candidatus Peribacteraceae bacterium]